MLLRSAKETNLWMKWSEWNLKEFTDYHSKCFIFFPSLHSVVDKPPIGGKELLPLTGHSLSGFRLNPGPVSIVWFSLQAFAWKCQFFSSFPLKPLVTAIVNGQLRVVCFGDTIFSSKTIVQLWYFLNEMPLLLISNWQGKLNVRIVIIFLCFNQVFFCYPYSEWQYSPLHLVEKK